MGGGNGRVWWGGGGVVLSYWEAGSRFAYRREEHASRRVVWDVLSVEPGHAVNASYALLISAPRSCRLLSTVEEVMVGVHPRVRSHLMTCLCFR